VEVWAVEKEFALRALIDVMRDHGAAGGALMAAIARAEKRAGLARVKEIDETQLDTLLLELAAEGGRIQQVAEQIASWRAEAAHQ
jgi:hypothetical protein